MAHARAIAAPDRSLVRSCSLCCCSCGLLPSSICAMSCAISPAASSKLPADACGPIRHNVQCTMSMCVWQGGKEAKPDLCRLLEHAAHKLVCEFLLEPLPARPFVLGKGLSKVREQSL